MYICGKMKIQQMQNMNMYLQMVQVEQMAEQHQEGIPDVMGKLQVER